MGDPKSEYTPLERNTHDAEIRAQQREAYLARYGLDLTGTGVAHQVLDEEVDSKLGKDLVTGYYVCQVGPHGGTEISGWELGNIFEALATRAMENSWLRMNHGVIQGDATGEASKLTSGSEDLKGALVEKLIRNKVWNRDGHPGGLTDAQIEELGAYEDKWKAVQARCEKCGDVGRVMSKWAVAYREAAELELLNRPEYDVRLNAEIKKKVAAKDKAGKLTPTELTNLEKKEKQKLKVLEVRAAEELDNERVQMKFEDVKMKGQARTKESENWNELTQAAIGVSEVFAVCRQWLTNSSDLDPISKLWIYQGRMAELHPSYLEAMAREYPAFNEAFRAVVALGDWKHALGDNGEIYISGKYNLGYVDTVTGRLVDVDEAVTRNAEGKITGLAAGKLKLNENQIYVPGVGAVDVNGGIAMVNGREVRMAMENFIYTEPGKRYKDKDVLVFLKKLEGFVKGKDSKSTDDQVSLAVEMAREVYEFTMLANWNGTARDSKGRPYYTMKNADGKDDWVTLTSNPDSQAYRYGGYLVGSSDEATTFPYWAGDWGKLTQTRMKQLGELGKGRKHGLYPLLPFLPESLVQPMIKQEVLDAVVNGTVKMDEVFGNMAAIEQFKTYWLDIFKGVAVYEFISDYFIGSKELAKAGDEVMALFNQTNTLEKLNKDIDLSLYWVDKTEAARLKVNIVLSALAAVSPEHLYEDYLRLFQAGDNRATLTENPRDVNVDEVKGRSRRTNLVNALRQLVASGFIGNEDDLGKIIQRLRDYGDNKTGLGFSITEFRETFGADYVDRITKVRETKKAKVQGRQEKGKLAKRI